MRVAVAAAALLSLAGDTDQLGRIQLKASAPEGTTGVRIVEVIRGADSTVAEGYEGETAWTCRRRRTFAALSDYQRSEPLVVSTPSCARRLRLQVLRRGRDLRVTVRDRWHLGGVPFRLCLRPPGKDFRCHALAVGPGQWEVSRLFRARAVGRWTVRVTALSSRTVRRVSVRRSRRSDRTLILTTGDSMMLTLSSVLEKRLRARVREDIYIGSGITKPSVIDWARLPAQHLRAHAQDATVITLGMGDVYPLDGIECCDADWTAQYALRARRVMRVYTRGGRALVWLNLPYPRAGRHGPAVTAVNAAVASASAGLPGVRVLDLAAMLTPDGVYREWIERRGRQIRLRRDDGVHLAAGGARIVARALRAELVGLGVLPSAS